MTDKSGNHVNFLQISNELYYDSKAREMVQKLTDYIHDAMSDRGYIVDKVNWQATIEVTVTGKHVHDYE